MPEESRADFALTGAEPKHLSAARDRARQEDISDEAVAGAMGNEPWALDRIESKPTPEPAPTQNPPAPTITNPTITLPVPVLVPPVPPMPEATLPDETLVLDDLQLAISDFANARISKEKMFGGGPEEQYKFDRSEAILQEQFHRWEADVAERINLRMQEIAQQINAINTRLSDLANRISTIQQRIADPNTTDAERQNLTQDLQAYSDTYAMYGERIQGLRMEAMNMQQDSHDLVLQKVAEVRQRVDAEMVAQREKARPGLSKVANWLKDHPKTRLIAGLAFSGMAITGLATGILPLTAIGIAGRSALAGFGVYNASRGVGEMIGNRQMNKADMSSIEGYTEGAEKQSNTRRRSKKVGLAGGAVAAAIPVIRNWDVLFGPPKPPIPTLIVTPPTPTTPIPNFPADTEVPWNHFANTLGMGPKAATEKIFELVDKAPRLGWTINHVGTGRAYSIPSIIAPDGRVITDQVGINRALDIINAAINQQGI